MSNFFYATYVIIFKTSRRSNEASPIRLVTNGATTPTNAYGFYTERRTMARRVGREG